MKTSDFIKRVKDLGYNAINGKYHLGIEQDSIELYFISETRMYSIDTNSNDILDRFNDEIKSELFDLMVEYARTPIDEREEEKKYRLILPNDSHVQMIYVYRPINKVFYFNDIGVTDNKEQDEFTEKEIKALPNQTLVDILERVEVK